MSYCCSRSHYLVVIVASYCTIHSVQIIFNFEVIFCVTFIIISNYRSSPCLLLAPCLTYCSTQKDTKKGSHIVYTPILIVVHRVYWLIQIKVKAKQSKAILFYSILRLFIDLTWLDSFFILPFRTSFFETENIKDYKYVSGQKLSQSQSKPLS